MYDYLNYKFPELTQQLLINLSYYCVYFFSKIQILVNKEKNNIYWYLKEIDLQISGKNVDEIIELTNNFFIKITDYINQLIEKFSNCSRNSFTTLNEENVKNKKDELLFDLILNNKINFSLYKEELINNLESTVMDMALLDSCDFVLVSDKENNIKIIDKQQLTIENLKNDSSEIFKILPTTYKPILCELVLDNKNSKINFTHKDGKYNYLIINNNFDDKFISYFIKTHYSLDIINKETGSTFDYLLKIIDDSVETILIDNKSILKITENKMIKI
jgi:hypothetical protein